MSLCTSKPAKLPVPSGDSSEPGHPSNLSFCCPPEGSLATHKAHSEDSDQTGQIPKLICDFAGRIGHFVGFVMLRLILN